MIVAGARAPHQRWNVPSGYFSLADFFLPSRLDKLVGALAKAGPSGVVEERSEGERGVNSISLYFPLIYLTVLLQNGSLLEALTS